MALSTPATSEPDQCELPECHHRLCVCGHTECGHADENVQPNCSDCHCSGFKTVASFTVASEPGEILTPQVIAEIDRHQHEHGYAMNASIYRTNLRVMAEFAVEQDRKACSTPAPKKKVLPTAAEMRGILKDDTPPSSTDPTWDQIDAIVQKYDLGNLSTIDTAALIWRLSAIESSADAALVARICTGRLADGKFTDDAYTAFNELCRKNAEPDDTAKK